MDYLNELTSDPNYFFDILLEVETRSRHVWHEAKKAKYSSYNIQRTKELFQDCLENNSTRNSLMRCRNVRISFIDSRSRQKNSKGQKLNDIIKQVRQVYRAIQTAVQQSQKPEEVWLKSGITSSLRHIQTFGTLAPVLIGDAGDIANIDDALSSIDPRCYKFQSFLRDMYSDVIASMSNQILTCIGSLLQHNNLVDGGVQFIMTQLDTLATLLEDCVNKIMDLFGAATVLHRFPTAPFVPSNVIFFGGRRHCRGMYKLLLFKDYYFPDYKSAKKTACVPLYPTLRSSLVPFGSLERKRGRRTGRSSKSEILFPLERDKQADLRYGKIFGQGGFGTVWEVHDPRTGEIFAIKKQEQAPSKKWDPLLLHELYILSTFRDPKIMSLKDAQLDYKDKKEALSTKMVLQPGKFSLYQVMPQIKDLSPAQLVSLLHQIFCGLAFLHAHHVLHLDIKPENVIVLQWLPQWPKILLADFGFAQLSENLVTQNPNWVFTQAYRPPELFCQGNNMIRSRKWKLDPSVDMFAAGIVLFQILGAWVLDCFYFPKWSYRSQQSSGFVENAFDFLKRIGSDSLEQTWKHAGCDVKDLPTENVQGRPPSHPQGHTPAPKFKEWIHDVFEKQPYEDVKNKHTSCARLSPEISNARSLSPITQILFQLGKKLLAFVPNERPSAIEVVRQLEEVARDKLHHTEAKCLIENTTSEWKSMMTSPLSSFSSSSKSILDDIKWISSPSIRKALKDLIQLFSERIKTKKWVQSEDEIQQSLAHVVVATKRWFEQTPRPRGFSTSLLLTMFLWLASFLFGGEEGRCCHNCTTTLRNRFKVNLVWPRTIWRQVFKS